MAKVVHRLSRKYGKAIDVLGGELGVKHKHYFSMKNVYMLMREWLVENGWYDRDESKHGEDFYYQRDNPAGTELWIWWRTKKGAKELGTSYYGYEMDMDIHVLTMKTEEVLIEGKKLKTNVGEFEVKIRARLIVDPKGTFEKHPLLKPFQTLFFNVIHKNVLSSYKRELFTEAHKLHDAVKTYLKLHPYGEEEEGEQFWLTKDYAPL